MRKNIIVLLLALLVSGSATAAEKPLGVEEFTSLDAVANEILYYFPKVQGEVKTVQGGLLTIGLGSKNGLVAGVTLTLWRDGKEIHHPVTGAVIGRTEDEVGSAEVTGVTEAACTAVILKKMMDPKPGDKARITPKKINLAIVPVRADRPEIIQGITDRLNDLGRFSILSSDKVTSFLKDRKQRDSSLISEMSKAFNLDVIAAVGIYPAEGGKLLLTVRLFYADEARPLDTVVAMLDLKSKDVFGDIKPFFAPVKEEQTSLPDLPVDVRFLAAADFEGIGSQQYAFSDGVRLHVYRREPTGWREEWTEPVLSGAGEIQHINLDVADINGNGRPELFVTAMQNGTVHSYVVEFRDGSYQRIADVPGFLRVIVYPGKGPILIGQDYNPRSFYSGKPRQYTWSDGHYVAGPELSLPRGVNLYGFIFATVGESSPLLIALDTKDHVLAYSGETLIWKSEDTYPSVGVSVVKPVTAGAAVISESLAETERSSKVRIPGRILALDMNGDGRDEIVLPRNMEGNTFFGGYSQAEFVSLGWTGTRFEQRWSIKDVGGAVLDFQIRQQDKTSPQILALVKTLGGLFAADRVRVMSYSAK